MRLLTSLMRYHIGSSESMAVHDYRDVFERAAAAASGCGTAIGPGVRVLDFGCGQRYPFALLARALGASVTAVDVEYVEPASLVRFAMRTARQSGVSRAVRACVRRALFDPGYYRALSGMAGQALSPKGIRFVVHRPGSRGYSLESGGFDVVWTNAVLEHVKDLEAVGGEIARVMAPSGVLWALMHNYYSLSGGHHLDWAWPSTHPQTAVPPWDHLREHRYPSHVYLNRATPQEFRRAFARHLRVVSFEGVDENHEPGALEGQEYLTPEIRAALAQYDETTLLTKAYLLVAVNDASLNVDSPERDSPSDTERVD